MQDRFAAVGGIAAPTSPRGYVSFILSENKKWGEIVRISGASVD